MAESASPFVPSSLRQNLLYNDRNFDGRVIPRGVPTWQFPGWGRNEVIHVDQIKISPDKRAKKHKLGQIVSTAICGNDITSSCLYTAGMTAAASGVLAPVSLLLVGVMLYLFRSVYSEVVLALPSNGGVYNCLLNTTSKQFASLAACLSILSYVATGTVSAISACHYLSAVFHMVNVPIATQILLSAFAFISLCGIKESGFVAKIIFFIHIVTLACLIAASMIFIFFGGRSYFSSNLEALVPGVGLLLTGFAKASLGISGFETSANFIEDQADGVFPLTLRNMWIASIVLNPALSLISLIVMPLSEIEIHQNALLSRMGRIVGGTSYGYVFETIVCIDAFIVLSGAVLTAFVGVNGLVNRMAFDRGLPEFLLQQNKTRNTSHWIILSFLFICSSMQWLLRGRENILAGVYSIAFLSVMALFGVGDALIKFKRNSIHRPIKASWSTIFTALIMVLLALYTTIASDLDMFRWFLLYFTFTIAAVVFMFYRLVLLRIALYFSSIVLSSFPIIQSQLNNHLTDMMQKISSQSVMFYTPNSHLTVINKAILYIRENEQASWIRIAYVCENESAVPSDFVSNVALLDSMYPKVRIDSVVVVGSMSQEMCDAVAHKLHIPVNMQFICCPEDGMRHLPTVRIITKYITSELPELSDVAISPSPSPVHETGPVSEVEAP
uniref:Amino acid permease/ SLC12A domain-containing protein n=1 Tax=Spongospora subterranea TaxID=70186 RepID=A0A0H5R9B6_9EUKA|eukprot:CRZ10277.1 hypothetical protein [Spongospora subterranea]